MHSSATTTEHTSGTRLPLPVDRLTVEASLLSSAICDVLVCFIASP